MAKTLARCKLCDAQKLLNSIGLCKRCGKNPLSVKISNKAFAKHEEALAQAAAQPDPEPEVEETSTEETTDTQGETPEKEAEEKKDK